MTDSFYNLEIHTSEIVINHDKELSYKPSLFLNKNYRNIVEIKNYLKDLFENSFEILYCSLKNKDFDKHELYNFKKSISIIKIKKINHVTLQEKLFFSWEFELNLADNSDFTFDYDRYNLHENLKELRNYCYEEESENEDQEEDQEVNQEEDQEDNYNYSNCDDPDYYNFDDEETDFENDCYSFT